MRQAKGIILYLVLIIPLPIHAQLDVKPRPSPLAIVSCRYKDAYLKITYSQPHKRGREIFGKIVPFGQVWRTGANEATEITITKDILINGIYTVTVTNSNTCTVTGTVSVTVNPLPTANINPATFTLTCTTPSTILTATGGGTYLWNTGVSTNTISVNSANTLARCAGCGAVMRNILIANSDPGKQGQGQ